MGWPHSHPHALAGCAHGMRMGCTRGMHRRDAHMGCRRAQGAGVGCSQAGGATQVPRAGPAPVPWCGCGCRSVGATSRSSLALLLLRPQLRAAFEVGRLPAPVLWPDLSAPRASPGHKSLGAGRLGGAWRGRPHAPGPGEGHQPSPPSPGTCPEQERTPARADTGTCTIGWRPVPSALTGHPSPPAKVPQPARAQPSPMHRAKDAGGSPLPRSLPGCPPAPRGFRLGSAPAARARRSGYLRYSEHFLGFIVFPSLSHLPRRKPSVPVEPAAPCPAGRCSRPAPRCAAGRGMASSTAFSLLAGGYQQQRPPGRMGCRDHAGTVPGHPHPCQSIAGLSDPGHAMPTPG